MKAHITFKIPSAWGKWYPVTQIVNSGREEDQLIEMIHANHYILLNVEYHVN